MIMKFTTNHFFYCFIGLLLTIPVFAEAQKSEISYFTFYQYANPSSINTNQSRFPQKSARHNKQSGSFILTFDEVPDSIQTAIRAASEFWASQIKNRQPIRIGFSFMSLSDFGENLATLTTASYWTGSTPIMPSALYAHINNLQISDEDVPDGIIWINSDLKWNCAFTPDKIAPTSLNIYSHILRSIAVCLGFGTSVSIFNPDEGLCFQENGCPSVFDNLIFSKKGRLSEFSDYSTELADFMTTSPTYVSKEDTSHMLYSPQEYALGESLIYLNNDQSLMHYGLGYGDVFFNIDNTTIEILNEIGWDIQEPKPTTILCNDISEDGIGSAYTEHTFMLSDESATNHNWILNVFDKNSNPITLCHSTDNQFIIPAIGDNPIYKRNINGDIHGSIECNYIKNGISNTVTFSLSLELKPTINSIYDIKRHWLNTSPNFGLTFCVDYSGADYLTLYIEQEYNSAIVEQTVNEPFIAHASIRSLIPIVYNWIDITVTNKYGSVTETIELEPITNKIISKEQYSSNSHPQTVAIYNSQGTFIGMYSEDDIKNLVLPRGLYIIKYTKDNFETIDLTKKTSIQ